MFTDDIAALGRRDWDADGDVPDDPVRLAVIGLGWFVRETALPSLAGADYCVPTTLVTGSPDRPEAVAETAGVERAISYEAYADGLARDAYDAVYVATPNALHPDHAVAAADLGKAVLCEKPLAATVAGAERIVKACADAGVPLMTAYRMQTDPVVRRLRASIGDLVGEIVGASGKFTVPALDGDRGPDQWRLDPALGGGGALMDLGIYPLNAVRYVLDADPVAVGAATSGTGAFAAVDERVDARFEFSSDVTVGITANFTGHPGARLSIHGTEGRVELRDAFQPTADRHLRIERDDGAALRIDAPETDEVREQFDYFARAVATGGAIEPDGADGLADLRAIARAYEAAETGRRTSIDC